MVCPHVFIGRDDCGFALEIASGREQSVLCQSIDFRLINQLVSSAATVFTYLGSKKLKESNSSLVVLELLGSTIGYISNSYFIEFICLIIFQSFFSRVTFLPPLPNYGMTQGGVSSPVNFIEEASDSGGREGRLFRRRVISHQLRRHPNSLSIEASLLSFTLSAVMQLQATTATHNISVYAKSCIVNSIRVR